MPVPDCGFARPAPRWRPYTMVSLGLLGLGGLVAAVVYYARLLPEAGMLLVLVAAQLLVFRRQCGLAAAPNHAPATWR